MTNDEFRTVVLCIQIEDEEIRVHKTSEQHSARTEHAEALSPDREEIWTEDIRDGVMDQIEASVRERTQVAHVAKHRTDREPFTISNRPVLIELTGRVVEDGDIGACCSEYGSLLTTTGCKAEEIDTLQIGRKPVTRRGLIADEHDRPIACASASDDIRADRT